MAQKRKKPYKHPARLHALWVIFLIYAVPPYAWHNMWVHRKYHPWFPYVIWINVIWVSIPSIVYLFFTHPQLVLAGKDPLLPAQFMYFTTLYGLAQIPYGLYLKDKIDKDRQLHRSLLYPTISIFLVDFVMTLIIVPMAIPFLDNPVYKILMVLLKGH